MPPRFAQDPALTQCPDFSSESYRLVREAYSAAHTISDEDAITALIRAWTDGNEAQKQAWVLQQEEDQRIRAEEERLRDQEAAALRQKEEAEAEAERVAIEKKKPKMNGFDPSKSVGDTIIPNPSQYALTNWAVSNGSSCGTSPPRPASRQRNKPTAHRTTFSASPKPKTPWVFVKSPLPGHRRTLICQGRD